MLKQSIVEQTKSMLQHLFEPAIINYYVRQVDMFDNRVIDYMD
jgi:hypothetical protein